MLGEGEIRISFLNKSAKKGRWDGPSGRRAGSSQAAGAGGDGGSGSGRSRRWASEGRRGQGRWRSSATLFWTAGPPGDGGEIERASLEASVWEKLVGTFDDGLVASAGLEVVRGLYKAVDIHFFSRLSGKH